MSLVLGITGGIATGKSTVVKVFKQLDFPVIDADVIAREIVEPGEPALQKIIMEFGTEMIKEDGFLNRKKLGSIIFSDEKKRQQLNQLLASYLEKAITKKIVEKKKNNQLIIVDIPLLYEEGYEKVVDKVAVVYVPEKIQQLRLMERDQLSLEEAKQRINSQWSIEYKKERADILFDNQKEIRETKQQVVQWLEHNDFVKRSF